MSLWIIEPRDPLVVRDGRPNQGRSESAARGFPLPSTVAGAVRTRLGLGPDGVFAKANAEELLALRAVAVRGPWLVEPDMGVFYAPTPHDLVVFGKGEQRSVRGLVPEPPEGAVLDHADEDLKLPMGTGVDGPGKPAIAPEFLRWESFERWLVRPGERTGNDAQALLAGSIDELPRESRMHVQVGEHETAEDEMLFEVTGLRFVHPHKPHAPLALAVCVDDAAAANLGQLREGLAPLGGKRRLVRWTRAELTLPQVPQPVVDAAGFGEHARVRVVLLTPAIFDQGWRPKLSAGTPLGPRDGLTSVRLVAACVGRPLAVSGWDLAKKRPKETRRAAAAGSVYWLELQGPAAARKAWIQRLWGKPVSEVEPDQQDGFGIVAIGAVVEQGGAQ